VPGDTTRPDPAKALLVATREYLENVRTRGFWISILMMPFILVVVSAAPMLLRDAESEARFAVLDRSGWVERAVAARIIHDDVGLLVASLARMQPNERPEPLADLGSLSTPEARAALVDATAHLLVLIRQAEHSIATPVTDADRIAVWWRDHPEQIAKLAPGVSSAKYAYVATPGIDKTGLNLLLATDQLLGYFEIPDDPVADASGATYVTRKLTNQDVRNWYSALVTDVVRDRRIREENITESVADWIQTPVQFASVRLDNSGMESKAERADALGQWAPVAFVYLLWISIFSIAQMLLTNTVEEKSNKLVEVLLSSIAPVELMAGKIVGIAATGLTIVGSWLTLLIAAALWLPGLLGGSASVDLSGLINDPTYLVSFIVYFVLGYLFYAALLCGIGSLANNLKEAQTLMMPIQMLLIVPLIVMVPIGRDPNGLLAQVLSWFPPFTPFVMMNRAAFPPGLVTYVGTTLLMVVSIVFALRGAARLFETGVLMTGKPPRLRHVFTLLRGHRNVAS
jgi:ABC-2 type transport system permease protein